MRNIFLTRIGQVLKLQAAIKFETGDVQGCRLLVNQADGSDPDTLVNQACLLYKEGKHKDAMVKYAESMKLSGNTPELSYYLALCHYMLKQYVPALKYIGDIIERGIREHPGACALGVVLTAFLMRNL